MLRTFIISLLLAVSFNFAATAKTPPEVLKPYKQYRAALEAGDNNKAFKKAKEAWEKAEDILGDSKTTGDLASNFAEVSPRRINYAFKDYEARMEGHKRAIELASFYGDDAANMELQRHIARIKTALSLTTIKGRRAVAGGKAIYFSKMEKALDAHDQRGSTFEADMEVLRARHHELRGEFKKSLAAANRAEEIFNTRTDNLVTHYPILLKLLKGNSLRGADQPIKAVLQYQDVMQNLEGQLSADHPFVKTAFTEWMVTRASLDEAGRLDEAEAAGLCECWPFENYKDKLLPLKRVPPVMPPRAKNSGYVTVLFDINKSGKTENIRVTGYTDKVFESAAASSVKKWQYSLSTEDSIPASRKDIPARIAFKLTNQSGTLLPEKEYKLVDAK